MRILFALIAMVSVIAVFGGAISEAETKPAAGPIVAELFTSQSCSSCPSAEAYFAELADREKVITIEWHVDYWDRLVHGRAGAWKDPYSDAAHTDRQSHYNIAIRGKTGVYTPQTVINGTLEGVGSRRGEVEDLLKAAGGVSLATSIDHSGKRPVVKIAELEAGQNAEVRFVRLLKSQSTKVKRGENHGRTLASRNIALSSKVLGQYDGTAAQFDLPKLHENESCVVLVQTTDDGPGAILGAATC